MALNEVIQSLQTKFEPISGSVWNWTLVNDPILLEYFIPKIYILSMYHFDRVNKLSLPQSSSTSFAFEWLSIFTCCFNLRTPSWMCLFKLGFVAKQALQPLHSKGSFLSCCIEIFFLHDLLVHVGFYWKIFSTNNGPFFEKKYLACIVTSGGRNNRQSNTIREKKEGFLLKIRQKFPCLKFVG